MCFENALEMLWKCANVRMKECFSLTFVASHITKHGKTLAYLHILTLTHFPSICTFSHPHICTFTHFPSICIFSHPHICTFPKY